MGSGNGRVYKAAEHIPRVQWHLEVADETGCHSRPEKMVACLERGRNMSQMQVSPNFDCRAALEVKLRATALT
jgi:hypothetical protein